MTDPENPSDELPPEADPLAFDPKEADLPADPAADDLVGQLQNQVADMQDRMLRSSAEMENTRKRYQRELADAVKYAPLPLMRDLLPVVDNLRRALDAASKTAEGAGLQEGVKLVMQQLEGVLSQHGCRPITALGQPFDHNLHQAVQQMPSPDQPAGNVLFELVPGYQLHDRVVRASQVVVSAGPDASS